MYCCSLLQNIILRQLFDTCNNHIFTTYTGIQNISHSYCAYEINLRVYGFKIENVRPTSVAVKFPFKFLSL